MKRKIVLGLLSLASFVVGTAAFAAATAGSISGIGSVAGQVTSNMTNLAKLITSASYVAGMAFAVGAVVKFKSHKDNPTQVPVSTGVVLLFVAAALIFIPSIFKVSGYTLFGASGTVGGPSGIANFGAPQPSTGGGGGGGAGG